MTLEWSSPSIIDFKEWRFSNFADAQELAQEALKELIIHSNLYAVLRDRSVYIFIRNREEKEIVATYQVEYLGDKKYEVYKV